MKQILDYLNLPKLGEAITTPVEEFAGKLVARATRRGKSDQWIAVKWNPSTLAPDICYDPNVCHGSITSIDEVYANPSEGVASSNSTPTPPVELSEFDLLTVAKIKDELTVKFGLKTTVLVGKNKPELYADLVALRAEAAELDDKEVELIVASGAGVVLADDSVPTEE